MACGQDPRVDTDAGDSTGSEREEEASREETTTHATSSATHASAGGTASTDASDADESDSRGSPLPRGAIAGTWALIGFEDPVVVSLVGGGGQGIEGVGCAVPGNAFADRCGALTGIEGDDAAGAEFSFAFGEFVYTALDVRLSDDGQRMTSAFRTTTGGRSIELGPVMTWLRTESTDTWLPDDHEAHFADFPVAMRLTLDESDPDSVFPADRDYAIRFDRRGLITGDLGAFHHSEMTFPQGVDAPIVVGPVQATRAESPIRIDIYVEELAPNLPYALAATMPTGRVHTFRASVD